MGIMLKGSSAKKLPAQLAGPKRNNRVALSDFETSAQKFNSLYLAFCEEQLHPDRLSNSDSFKPEDVVLTAAALSVQESIKIFLAIARIVCTIPILTFFA